MVFQGKEQFIDQCIDMVKFRVAWWFKHHAKGSTDPISLILLDVGDRCRDSNPRKKRMSARWKLPSLDCLKFNVDGSAKGSPGPAGMGGVLRDSYGKVICLFFSFLGIFDGISAEIEEIHKACVLCLSNCDLRNRCISIVSDSKTAMDWINEADQICVSHPTLIQVIRFLLSSLSNTTVSYSSRSSNSFADLLAKKASSMGGDFVQWGDT